MWPALIDEISRRTRDATSPCPTPRLCHDARKRRRIDSERDAGHAPAVPKRRFVGAIRFLVVCLPIYRDRDPEFHLCFACVVVYVLRHTGFETTSVVATGMCALLWMYTKARRSGPSIVCSGVVSCLSLLDRQAATPGRNCACCRSASHRTQPTTARHLLCTHFGCLENRCGARTYLVHHTRRHNTGTRRSNPRVLRSVKILSRRRSRDHSCCREISTAARPVKTPCGGSMWS